ncbi:MAG: hypothetical protein ACK44P_03995 [Bacteroidota bacterium]|jgi:hypothetical protein|nr:hypothetical protein [Sphingobacteriales bacterium]
MQEKDITTQILEKLAAMEHLTHSMSAQHRIGTLDSALLRKTCVDLYELILQIDHSTVTLSSKSATAETTQMIKPTNEETDTQEALQLFADEQVHESPVSLINDIPPFTEEAKTEVSLPPAQEKTIINHSVEKAEEITPPLVQELNLNKGEDELLHEKIAKTVSTQTDLSKKFQSKVESLKSAITLNRKIAFVNELFKENTVDYASAIEALNNATDLSDAHRIFSDLKYNFNWDENNALVKELEALVVKRYQAF